MIGRTTPVGELFTGKGPFSRMFVVDDIQRDRTLTFNLVASPSECEAVATELHLEAIHALKARLVVTRQARGLLQVEGEVQADIEQMCVVTLEPFATHLTEPVSIKFAPQVIPGTPPHKVDLAEAVQVTMDEDPPDPIINGRVDLGATVVEFLALGLDPYPRKPGVAFEHDVPEPVDEKAPSPFAALAGLKNPDKA